MVTYNRPGNQSRLATEHTVLKQEQITQLGVQALQSRAWVPQIFTMFPGDRFKGALNDTLTWTTGRFTVARDYEWRTRLSPVQLDRIGTTHATVKLDQHLTQATAVTNEQVTMDLTSFAGEILEPQLRAINDRITFHVMKGLRDAPLARTDINASTGDDPYAVALQAHLALQREGVPGDGRFWIVGANAEEWLLSSDVLLDPNRGGNSLARDNSLGRIRGFEVVSGSALIGENEMFFGHKSGLLVANIAPEAPMDVPNSGRYSGNGFSLMGTLMYSDRYQSTTSTLSTYLGVNSVNDQMELEPDGSERAGLPVFDENGDPKLTGKNVRIASGEFSI